MESHREQDPIFDFLNSVASFNADYGEAEPWTGWRTDPAVQEQYASGLLPMTYGHDGGLMGAGPSLYPSSSTDTHPHRSQQHAPEDNTSTEVEAPYAPPNALDPEEADAVIRLLAAEDSHPELSASLPLRSSPKAQDAPEPAQDPSPSATRDTTPVPATLARTPSPLFNYDLGAYYLDPAVIDSALGDLAYVGTFEPPPPGLLDELRASADRLPTIPAATTGAVLRPPGGVPPPHPLPATLGPLRVPDISITPASPLAPPQSVEPRRKKHNFEEDDDSSNVDIQRPSKKARYLDIPPSKTPAKARRKGSQRRTPEPSRTPGTSRSHSSSPHIRLYSRLTPVLLGNRTSSGAQLPPRHQEARTLHPRPRSQPGRRPVLHAPRRDCCACPWTARNPSPHRPHPQHWPSSEASP